jgi:hypothetical protein
MRIILEKKVVRAYWSAEGNSGLLKNFGRYLAGMLIGSLVTSMHLLQPIPVPVDKHRASFALMGVYKDMLRRDDKLLTILLDGSWRRDCGYRVVPWVLLKDGSMRQSIIQVCTEE